MGAVPSTRRAPTWWRCAAHESESPTCGRTATGSTAAAVPHGVPAPIRVETRRCPGGNRASAPAMRRNRAVWQWNAKHSRALRAEYRGRVSRLHRRQAVGAFEETVSAGLSVHDRDARSACRTNPARGDGSTSGTRSCARASWRSTDCGLPVRTSNGRVGLVDALSPWRSTVPEANGARGMGATSAAYTSAESLDTKHRCTSVNVRLPSFDDMGTANARTTHRVRSGRTAAHRAPNRLRTDSEARPESFPRPIRSHAEGSALARGRCRGYVARRADSGRGMTPNEKGAARLRSGRRLVPGSLTRRHRETFIEALLCRTRTQPRPTRRE